MSTPFAPDLPAGARSGPVGMDAPQRSSAGPDQLGAAPAAMEKHTTPQPLAMIDCESRHRRAARAGTAGPDGGFEDADAMAELAQADVADADLLWLVLCAAGAAMLLALATSLV